MSRATRHCCATCTAMISCTSASASRSCAPRCLSSSVVLFRSAPPYSVFILTRYTRKTPHPHPHSLHTRTQDPGTLTHKRTLTQGLYLAMFREVPLHEYPYGSGNVARQVCGQITLLKPCLACIYVHTHDTCAHTCACAHSCQYARTYDCGWKVISIRVPEIVVSTVLADGLGRPSSANQNQKGLSLKVFSIRRASLSFANNAHLMEDSQIF